MTDRKKLAAEKARKMAAADRARKKVEAENRKADAKRRKQLNPRYQFPDHM